MSLISPNFDSFQLVQCVCSRACETQAGLHSELYSVCSSSTSMSPYTVLLLVCDLFLVEMMAHVLQQNTSQL
jgi:hypothetical protein